jgi:UDP-glucose:(heptosyl)LPS alpha-1,3-glucosyltransferase
VKIALVLEKFDPVRGGAEHWTWQFARSLVRRGHEVHVVAFGFHEAVAEDAIVPHQLGEMPRSRLDRAAQIAAKLGTLNFDIVHDMGIGWAADIVEPHAGSTKALWQHNLMRIPKWRQIRFWREKRYRELEEIERRQHADPDVIIVAVSRMLAQNFESLHRLAPERIRVIYNGVDIERFTPSVRDKYREKTRRDLGVRDEVLFLMLAHNLLLKNADSTIRAAAELTAAGARLRLVIAGGKKPERFIKLAHKLGIARLVTFLGQVDPLPYYAAADVFVHPTWYDPCSLVTLEASGCGLPVITSRFNGAAELMTDGKEGFLINDPGDITTLAEKMGELLESASRAMMGAAGRAFATQHPFEEQTSQFLQLYGEMASTKRHRHNPIP